MRAAAEAAKQAKQPKPFTAPGPSHRTGEKLAWAEDAPAADEKAKATTRKERSIEKEREHIEEEARKEARRVAEKEAKRAVLQKATAIQQGY